MEDKRASMHKSAVVERQAATVAGKVRPAAAAAREGPRLAHIESISLELEWNRFRERVAKRARSVWEHLTPAERRHVAQQLIAQTLPTRRGGFGTALAELINAVPDKSAGLWVEEETRMVRDDPKNRRRS